jgi:hypothetical protein
LNGNNPISDLSCGGGRYPDGKSKAIQRVQHDEKFNGTVAHGNGGDGFTEESASVQKPVLNEKNS